MHFSFIKLFFTWTLLFLTILPYFPVTTIHAQTANPIVAENNKPGTTAWTYENMHIETNVNSPLVGYASETSINHGETINFHISSVAPTYTMQIYRLGYYQGKGARLIQEVTSLPGTRQTVTAPDTITGIVEANWPTSYTLATTTDWVSGAYFAKLIGSDNSISYIQFVIRADEQSADILYQLPIATEQAYNNWGGKSLYDYNSPGGRANKVSFSRPYARSSGAADLFTTQYGFIRFLEQRGYNIAYATSVDTHRSSQLLSNKKAFVSTYHDEYWSKEMRDNITTARNNGKNLAFFDANNIYYQIRFESSITGIANRTMVGYKDAAKDPVIDRSLTTIRWRDNPVNQPENELLGIMFEAMVDYENPYPLTVSNASHWIYEGTGLNNGDSIPGVVGYEYDKVFNNGKTPANLEILATTPLLNHEGNNSNAHMTLYQHASGSIVFAAGTMFWHHKINNNDYSWQGEDARLQRITTNLLDRMIGAPITPPSPTPTPSATPSATPTSTPSATPTSTPTATPTPVPTATPTPTPVPGQYPRELPPNPGSHPKIKIIETQPNNGRTVFIKLEVDPTVTAYQTDWYINGGWKAQDNTAPYVLGSELNGNPQGYLLATDSAVIRPVVYYNSWFFVEASTTYTVNATQPPTPTPTPVPTATPTPTPVPTAVPTPTPTPVPTLTPTPTPTPTTTPTPTPVPTVVPTPTPTPTPNPNQYPKELPSTNTKIKIIETAPRQANTVFIKIEVDPNVTAYQTDWYLNGKWKSQDKAVPYFLGGDNLGVGKGYVLPTNSTIIRPVVYYNSWFFIEATTTYTW